MSFGSWVWSWVKRVRGVSNYIVGSCKSVAMHMGRLWGGDKGCEGIGSGRVGRVSMAQAPPRFPLRARAAHTYSPGPSAHEAKAKKRNFLSQRG